MNRKEIEQYTDSCNLVGIYRGEVIDNDDPKRKGRVKLFVYGVYLYDLKRTPELLPWAEPAMSIFGGNWTNNKFKRMTIEEKEALSKAGKSYDYNETTYFGDKEYDTTKEVGLNQETGWCSVPHGDVKQKIGSQVFCFFEGGDANKPVYFATAQSGDGWISEYPNQHTIKTDNVSVIINEDYDGVKQITENQVSIMPKQSDNSAVFNEYANKKASEFIPCVDLNDDFESFDSDNTNGYIEKEGLKTDGNNFGTYSTTVNTTAEYLKELEQKKQQIAQSKPDSLNHTIDETEISFYETKMPIVEFSWNYQLPDSTSEEDIDYYEVRISNDPKFQSILKYKCNKEEKKLKVNTLHVGTFYIKVRAVFAEYGKSDWSASDTVTIKYKEDVKIDYEPEKITRPTRVNIFVENRSGVAINLRILGDVNMNIDGNVTEVITGDKIETINGSYVQRIRKGYQQIVEGVAVIQNKNNVTHQILGANTLIVHKDCLETYMQCRDVDVLDSMRLNVFESTKILSANNIKVETTGSFDISSGNAHLKTTDAFSVNAMGGIGMFTSTFQCNCGENIELAAINQITIGCNMFYGLVISDTTLTTNTLLTNVLATRNDYTGGEWISETIGNFTEIVEGNKVISIQGNNTEAINGLRNISVTGNSTININGNSAIIINGTSVFDVSGTSAFTAKYHTMYPTSPHVHISTMPGSATTPPIF